MFDFMYVSQGGVIVGRPQARLIKEIQLCPKTYIALYHHPGSEFCRHHDHHRGSTVSRCQDYIWMGTPGMKKERRMPLGRFTCIHSFAEGPVSCVSQSSEVSLLTFLKLLPRKTRGTFPCSPGHRFSSMQLHFWYIKHRCSDDRRSYPP